MHINAVDVPLNGVEKWCPAFAKAPTDGSCMASRPRRLRLPFSLIANDCIEGPKPSLGGRV